MQLFPNKRETEEVGKVTYNRIIFPPLQMQITNLQEPVVTSAGHSTSYGTLQVISTPRSIIRLSF